MSHGRDATVSDRSVREGTTEGTPDHRSAMGTHVLRVVPSQQCTATTADPTASDGSSSPSDVTVASALSVSGGGGDAESAQETLEVDRLRSGSFGTTADGLLGGSGSGGGGGRACVCVCAHACARVCVLEILCIPSTL